MKKVISFFLFILIGYSGYAQSKPLPVLPSGNLNFIVASDMGRSVISEQQNIADLMGMQAEKSRMDFIAVAGDPIHDDGVKSVTDEEWKRKFENIYTSGSLQNLPFYVVSGNHEYRGNVQAILDYSLVSKRWKAPQRYYSMKYPIGASGKDVLLVFIDTAPLIDRLRTGNGYSDAGEQSIEQQLHWLDSTLVASKDQWKVVIGHHPVYADTYKAESERTDMQKRIGRILENRRADFYICGHIHNFQYIKPKNGNVHYIVNSSASLSREVQPVEGTVFCNSDPGYSVFTVSADSIQFFFVNHKGKTVYEHTVSPKNN